MLTRFRLTQSRKVTQSYCGEKKRPFAPLAPLREINLAESFRLAQSRKVTQSYFGEKKHPFAPLAPLREPQILQAK